MMNEKKTKEENMCRIKDKMKDMLEMIGFDECPDKSSMKRWIQSKERETKNILNELQRRRY